MCATHNNPKNVYFFAHRVVFTYWKRTAGNRSKICRPIQVTNTSCLERLAKQSRKKYYRRTKCERFLGISHCSRGQRVSESIETAQSNLHIVLLQPCGKTSATQTERRKGKIRWVDFFQTRLCTVEQSSSLTGRQRLHNILQKSKTLSRYEVEFNCLCLYHFFIVS